MTLTKQNKMLLGLGVLGVAAYLIWKQNQEKQNFISLSRSRSRGRATNLMSEFGDAPRPKPILVPDSEPIGYKFLPQGCKKADCRDGDSGYIYCKGKDRKGRQNFAMQMQDGSDINDIPAC
jgi:hypothetical protein